MKKPVNTSSSSDAPDTRSQEEKDLDAMIIKAVAAAAKGENIEQLLDVMLASIPTALREKCRKKYAAALTKKGLRLPSDKPEIASHGTLARIRDLFAITAQQAYARVVALMRARPDLASQITQVGQVLLKNGVLPNATEVSEADLGTMQPIAGIGKGQDKNSGRGA